MSDPSTDEATEETQDAQGEEERPVDVAPDDHEIEQIEQDREERLDPDNRPENAEVDNTGRDFDERHGRFTDSEPPEGEEREYAISEEEAEA